MASPFFEKLRGTIETIFQIGLGGPQLKANGAVIEARDADDTGFVRLKAATPTEDNDVTTKLYTDSLQRAMVVKRQADTSISIPNNTAVRGFVVVTTAGSGAVLGAILFDDGSNTGTMTILVAVEGRTITTTDTLSGGTITFDADAIYIWDDDGTIWIKSGDVGNISGAVREIRYAIDNTASQDSVTILPANARINYAGLEITTPYSGGASIEIGTTGDANAFQETTDNNPQGAAPTIYAVSQDSDIGGPPSVVRTTIAGSPGAGAGFVVIRFALSDG